MSPLTELITGAKAYGWSSFTPTNTSFESIATVSVGAGGSSTITFSSISGTYKHLQLRFSAETTTGGNGGDDVLVRFNGDSSTNYARHRMLGSGTSLTSSNNTSQTGIALTAAAARSQGGSGLFNASCVLDILDYSNTSKNKVTRSIQGADYNGSGEISFIGGLWINTTAITSIVLTPEQNLFAEHSHFALYGIKGAA